MDGVLALLQSTLRSVQEMQALASLPNNQLNCYRALKEPNEHCYRACRQGLLQSLLEFRTLYSLQHLRSSSKLLDPQRKTREMHYIFTPRIVTHYILNENKRNTLKLDN